MLFRAMVAPHFAYNRRPWIDVTSMAKKLFVKTHGCQMNEYDSARMYDVLRETQGYERAETEAEADVLLLNTCSIREKAQEKVFHQLGRWQKLKTERPDLVIGVGGGVWQAKKVTPLCAARRWSTWCLGRKRFIGCRRC